MILLRAAYGLLFMFVLTARAIRLRMPPNIQKSNKYYPHPAGVGRVIGGQDAEIGSAPYQISIQGMYDGHMCGGSIIDKQWIITAAHCVHGYNPSYLRVITGTNKWTEPGAIYFPDEYWVHCNYNNPLMHNDIALIHLNDSIKLNGHTKVIPLVERPLQEGEDISLTGWGSTELWGNAPIKLQRINLKFMNHTNCVKALQNDQRLDVGHICTFTQVGEGACHGDSGGPLTSGGFLVGLVNWGYPCATGVPDAHANIYYYRDWIRRTMTRCKTCYCSASNYFS